MKVGIYGGSFNPIHNGHIALAEAFLRQAKLDEVWFMVSPQNPLKANARLLDDKIRFKMVQKVLKHKRNLIACDYEFHLPKRFLHMGHPSTSIKRLPATTVHFAHW